MNNEELIQKINTELEKKDGDQLISILNSLKQEKSVGDFLKAFLKNELSAEEVTVGFQRFHLEGDSLRQLFLVSFPAEYSDLEKSILNNLFEPLSSDIVEIDMVHLAIICSISHMDNPEETASIIVDAMRTEALQNVSVAYDRPSSLSELSQAYRNALIAMEIGLSFYSNQQIFDFHQLGLAKLIYRLPQDARDEYILDNFSTDCFKDIDAETYNTIRTFLECNLSIADTARELYLHRNTLVYRLDKFEKQTGLDVRRFEDAVKVKIGLLLKA